MKKSMVLFQIILLTLTLPVFGQDLYDINTISTVEITFTESNWDQLLDDLVTEGLENRLLGTAVVNGIIFDSVGVRYKGNSTYSASRTKNPFNIKLDYTIGSQEYGEYGTLKLANVYNDPSFVRETLGYEIARTYMPASQANYIKVTVNGTYIGLYTSVQDVDKYFAQTHFYSKNGTFIKGDVQGDMQTMSTDTWCYYDTDSSSYTEYYELQSDTGWPNIIGFLDTLNNYNSEVESVLNVDRHLWMLAYDNLLVNLDSPINYAHNYYLYQDENNRFNPIVWDFNENFGVFTMILEGGTGPMSTTGLQQLDPFLHENTSTYPIISKILSNDTYKKIYVAHMKTIIDDWFSDGTYETRANELQAIIDTEVQNDPNKFFTYSNFLSNVTSSISSGGFPPQDIVGITQLMDARVSYLNTQSEFTATQPTITNVSGSVSKGYVDVPILATVTDETDVMVGYRSTEDDVFTKITMYDDGSHGDGNAGDDIYGVTIPYSSTSMQYYIFAENNNAAALSPPRAEYEFYTVTISGDIVINEFMAKNDVTVTDQDGEYEDWIELYNNTGVDVSLLGYYLSDNSALPTKWAFPDTTITANGYLIIWADEDELQNGLHANFKLSASGESVLLVDSEQKTIDEILFGEQTVGYTTGRYANGIGSFIEMPPSFNAVNIDGSSISAPLNVTVVSVTDTETNIAWNQATGATSYYIYRSTDPYGTFSQIGSSTVLNYVDTSVSTGDKFFYYVIASNSKK
ncbi:MAG: CotH kinase family protein [Candidatus Delongbacteria bacterium]|jgi:spore coat protein CotH|nr:CotH kinase family protein [Candidatus Delongbacteria bacterium]